MQSQKQQNDLCSFPRQTYCPRDSQESSPKPQFKSISSSVLSLLSQFLGMWACEANLDVRSHIYTWVLDNTKALAIQTFVGKVMPVVCNMLSSFVIVFLPKGKCFFFCFLFFFLISWLQLLSAVILEPKKIKSVTVCIVSPCIWHEVMGLDAMILVF